MHRLRDGRGRTEVIFVALLGLIVGLLLASTAHGQTLGPLVDKQPLGLAGTEWWPLDLDGDVRTDEYLGLRFDPDSMAQIVYVPAIVREGRICVGAPIDPVALAQTWATEFSAIVISEVRGRWVMVVQGDRYYREVVFDLPVCR